MHNGPQHDKRTGKGKKAAQRSMTTVLPLTDNRHTTPVADMTVLQDRVRSVLALAKQAGATSACASMDVDAGYEVVVRLGELETLLHHRDQGMRVTVYCGQRSGACATTDLSDDALRNMVEKAYYIAKMTEEDPCAGLPDVQDKARAPFDVAALSLHHGWSLSAQDAMQLAMQTEQACLAGDTRLVNSEGFQIETNQSSFVYGDTQGFLSGYATSRHAWSCSLIAKSAQDAGMQRDYAYSVARDPADLLPPERVAAQAAEKVLARLGARGMATRVCDVVLVPALARSFFSLLAQAISGGAQYKKCSFLLDALNQPVLPEGMHITDDPFIPKGLASSPFDSEGVQVARAPIIENGCLKTYLLSSYTARKLHMRTNGHAGGMHNWTVQSDSHIYPDQAALLRAMGTGLLVTDTMGHGINVTTGDYSQGAFGYWVENGCIQYPVHEITLAGNLKTMFTHIRGISQPQEINGAIRVGATWIAEMTVAGAQ